MIYLYENHLGGWFGFCWAILSAKATPEKIKNNQKLTCREPRKKRTRNVNRSCDLGRATARI